MKFAILLKPLYSVCGGEFLELQIFYLIIIRKSVD